MAVSTAEISSAATPTMPIAVPVSIAAEPMSHLLTKPGSSGVPISEIAPTVYTAQVNGMTRERPRRSSICVRPVFTITAPAQKNSVILISAWKSMCASAAVRPLCVIRLAASTM